MSFDDLPPLPPLLRPEAKAYAERISEATRTVQRTTRTALDQRYGDDYWQKVDVYLPADPSARKLPVLCFLLISFVSLLVTLEKLDSRVGMNTAMLIASVMFHLAIGSQLPPAGYLTMADKVMVATYATIAVNLLLSVLMMRAMQLNHTDWAKRMREQSFKLVPGLATLAYAVVVMS